MDTQRLNREIPAPSARAGAAARARWDAIAKPIGSLGLLEEAIVRMAALTGSADISIQRRAAAVMCADNGVVAEGVTQTGSEITALVAGNMARGEASVCRMARVAGAEVFPIDVGMLAPAPGVRDMAVMRGTRNMLLGPAMTREEAARAVSTGMAVAHELACEGYNLIVTGEMGIGNTTTSSALASVLLGLAPEAVTGRGAGLSGEGVRHKIAVIERAIKVNSPSAGDPMGALAAVGGLDIAAMAGLFIGGAMTRTPVVIDGFISAVAALVSYRLCPRCIGAIFPSHVSAEPAARLVLDALGLEPVICAGLRLGEGTGALCVLPLYDMALSVYREMVTFENIGMDAYTRKGEG